MPQRPTGTPSSAAYETVSRKMLQELEQSGRLDQQALDVLRRLLQRQEQSQGDLGRFGSTDRLQAEALQIGEAVARALAPARAAMEAAGRALGAGPTLAHDPTARPAFAAAPAGAAGAPAAPGAAPVAKALEPLEQWLARQGGQPPAAPAGGDGGGGVGGMALGALGAVGVAAGVAAASLGAVVAASRGYVAALNPSAVMAMDQAMRDLSATIGVALQPVISAMTQFARMTASVLLPIMQQLAPIVGRLASSVLEGGRALLGLVSVVAGALMPALDAVAAAVAALMPIFQAFAVILAGIVEVIGTIFKSMTAGLTDTIGDAKDAIQELALSAILAAASLAKFVGADSFIDGMIKALDPARQSAAGLAAVQNPQFQAFAEYGRQVSLAAARAGGPGGGGAMTEESFRERLLKIAEDIRDGKGGFVDVVDRLAWKVVKAFLPKFLGGTDFWPKKEGYSKEEHLRDKAAREGVPPDEDLGVLKSLGVD